MEHTKIGQVARQLGLSERRIREYERAGLIRIRRQAKTGDRVFSDTDLAQLHTIKCLIHERGMTIDAIRQLMLYAPCWELTGCGHRDTCPAFHHPHEPCYRQRASGVPMPCAVDCQRCALYQSKESARECIVVRPADGPPEG